MSEVSCEICFNAFNDKDKIPKVLECGHTLCSHCLLKLIQSSKTCPSCSQLMTKNSAEEFLTNYFVLGLTPNDKTIKEHIHKDVIFARKEKIKEVVEQCVPLLHFVSLDLEKCPNQLRCNSDGMTKVADEAVLQAENHLWEAFETFKLKQKEYFGAELFLKDFVDIHQFLYQISILCHQGANVFAKHGVNGVAKYGKVILWNGSIRIYSLSLSEVEKNSTIVLFPDLQTCVTESLGLFMEFCDKRTYPFTPMKNNLLPFYLKFFTAEGGITFKGAKFRKNQNCVNIERCILNGVPTQGTFDYISYLPEGLNQTFRDKFLLIGNKEGTLKIEKITANATARGNVIGTGNFILENLPDLGFIEDCGLCLKLQALNT